MAGKIIAGCTARISLPVAVLIVALGCGSSSPSAPIPQPGPSPTPAPTPQPSPSPTPTPPVGLISVRIDGLAIDADSEAPIANAVITTVQVLSNSRYAAPSQPASTTADSNGRFVLNATLPPDWRDLMLEVVKAGYETASIYTDPIPGVDTLLRAYRTITIRPGDSIELRVFLGHYVCGDESYQCRRILVEAPSGSVEVEIAPVDSRDSVGLVTGWDRYGIPFPGNQTRVTVPAGPVWIIGGGKVRLSARMAP